MKADKNLQQSEQSPAYLHNPAEIDEQAPLPKYGIRPLQIYILVSYYIVLLIVSGALLTYLILVEESAKPPLLVTLGFVASGAIAGSVLYQIRMLFRHYIKYNNFDSKWLGKYISAPWEAVALSLAVTSLIRGGGIVLGGGQFKDPASNNYAAFGLGALIGFGIREVVGWLGKLAKTMFPTHHDE